jgi:hypothetical protein
MDRLGRIAATEHTERLDRPSVALMHSLSVVMPGLVPGTHVFRATKQDVGGRDKPGHDALGGSMPVKPATIISNSPKID